MKNYHYGLGLVLGTLLLSYNVTMAMANSSAKLQIIEPGLQQHNITINQIAGDQMLVGIWRDYSGKPSGQNDVIPSRGYRFSADGTFKFNSGSQFKTGKYQVVDNTIKYIYSNGSIERYTFKFKKDSELKILTLTQGDRRYEYSYMGLGHR
jgi:hypothetical protein